MYSENELIKLIQKVGADIIESGEVENAKPIYCHPVYLKYSRSDSSIVEITMLIFNNNATAFTKDTFITWATQLFNNTPDAKILTSGFIGVSPVCCFKKSETNPDTAFNLIRTSTTTASGTTPVNFSEIRDETTIFEDGVNKIN